MLQYLPQVRTFKGHTNEKNFVGLTVNSDYIACGSETNEVFVYHKVTHPNPYMLRTEQHTHRHTHTPLSLCLYVWEPSEKFESLLQEIQRPVTWHRFGLPEMEDAEDEAASHFISAVCWKSDSPTMLTANSQGTIKVLVLAA